MKLNKLNRLLRIPQAKRLYNEYQLVFKLQDLIRQGKSDKYDAQLPEHLRTKLNTLNVSHLEQLQSCYTTAHDGYEACKSADELSIMGRRGATWLQKHKPHWFNQGPIADDRKADITQFILIDGTSNWDYASLLSAFAPMPTTASAKEKALHLKLYLTLMQHVSKHDKNHLRLSSGRLDQLLTVLETLQSQSDTSHRLIQPQLVSIIAYYKAYLDSCDLSQGWSDAQISQCNRLLALCLPPAQKRSETTASQLKSYIELVSYVTDKGYLQAFPQLLAVLPSSANSEEGCVPFKLAASLGSSLSACHRSFLHTFEQKQLVSTTALTPTLASINFTIEKLGKLQAYFTAKPKLPHTDNQTVGHDAVSIRQTLGVSVRDAQRWIKHMMALSGITATEDPETIKDVNYNRYACFLDYQARICDNDMRFDLDQFGALSNFKFSEFNGKPVAYKQKSVQIQMYVEFIVHAVTVHQKPEAFLGFVNQVNALLLHKEIEVCMFSQYLNQIMSCYGTFLRVSQDLNAAKFRPIYALFQALIMPYNLSDNAMVSMRVDQFQLYIKLIEYNLNLSDVNNRKLLVETFDSFLNLLKNVNRLSQLAPEKAQQIMPFAVACYQAFDKKLTQYHAQSASVQASYARGPVAANDALPDPMAAVNVKLDALPQAVALEISQLGQFTSGASSSTYLPVDKERARESIHSALCVVANDVTQVGRQLAQQLKRSEETQRRSNRVLLKAHSVPQLPSVSTPRQDDLRRHSWADVRSARAESSRDSSRPIPAAPVSASESKWSPLQFFINILGNFAPFTMFGGLLSTSKFPAANEMTREQHARNDERHNSQKRYTV